MIVLRDIYSYFVGHFCFKNKTKTNKKMDVNVKSVLRNFIICCSPVSYTGPTAVNELRHVCMVRPAQMFSVWPVHPVYSLCAGVAIYQLCVYFSYLSLNRTHGSRLALKYVRMLITHKRFPSGAVYRGGLFMWFLRAATAHGWVSFRVFFGRWCCTVFFFHEAEQKGELCSAQRKWADSSESLDGVTEKIEGGCGKARKERTTKRGTQML